MAFPQIRFPVIDQPGQAEWHAADVYQHQLSALQQQWLLDPDSLTAKLKANSQHFAVQLLGQQQAAVMANEARWLTAHERATVREVILWCDDKPWVFARSVFPHSALQQEQLALGKLGERPLGEHLFQQSDLARSSIELCRFEEASQVHHLHQQLGFPAQPLWGRRSCFSTAGQQVLVAEVFIGAAPLYHYG